MILILLSLIINPPDSLLGGAQIGFCFYDITNDTFVVSYNWNKNFVPASNLKLLTTAAGLFLLGPQYRFKTKFGFDSDYNLYIIAGGDPTLTRKTFTKKLLEIKRKRGKTIKDIFIESRSIHGFRFPWGWSWHYLDAAYAPRMTGLILDGNTFDLMISPGDSIGDSIRYDYGPRFNDIQIDNQAITFAPDSGWKIDLYRELGANRVHIYGGVGMEYQKKTIPISLIDPPSSHLQIVQNLFGNNHNVYILEKMDSLPDLKVTDSIVSLPLLIILKRMNYESENLYAEAIINRLSPSDTVASTLNGGINALKSLLARLRIDTSNTAIYDGSGLSRFNRITPLAMIKLLVAMYRSRYRDHFISTLPYGGEGTLWNRFKEEGTQIRCKTGTVYGVSCLSGYLLKDDRKIAFTIMINDLLGKRRSVEKWQEGICRKFLEE